MTAKHWTLREELYKSFHQWPALLVFSSLGCLIGLAIAFLWPSSYRATVQVYVGLNPYRTFSDARFLALSRPKYSNLDDYKNWQMSQLESVIYLEDIIQETLADLRQVDSYWNGVDSGALREILLAEWRSAGTWSLVATHPNSARAAQAAETWSLVVIGRVDEAVAAAQQTFMIDQELQALAEQQLQAAVRYDELSAANDALASWSGTLRTLSSDQPLGVSERWRGLSLVTNLAQFTPAWTDLLKRQPTPDALPAAYLVWIDQVTLQISAELPALQQRSASLEGERNRLSEQYAYEMKNSLGLSPNLAIEKVEQSAPEEVRSSGALTILGGLIGLLAWGFFQVLRITRKVQNL